MFTELDVVNEMLATIGAVPLNGLSEDNPDVANCRRILNIANKTIQGQGWWFNKEQVTLIADASSGMVYIPNDAISTDLAGEYGPYQVVVRDRRLYNTDKNTFIFEPGQKFVCNIIRLVNFTKLPVNAQRAIMISAVIKFQQCYDADNTKTQMLMQEYAQSMILLKTEHIRNFNSSLLWKKSTTAAFNRYNGYRQRW